jgi:hypothetical protein
MTKKEKKKKEKKTPRNIIRTLRPTGNHLPPSQSMNAET